MRIALTHNLRVSDAEDEAEFYHPANIADLVAALNSNGHVVLTVDVGLPVTSWLRHLEDFAPELVFNCAEGAPGGPARPCSPHSSRPWGCHSPGLMPTR